MVYSTQCSSAYSLSMTVCSFYLRSDGKELSSLLSALVVLI